MERWQRERILGEWGVRDGSGLDRLERQRIEEDLAGQRRAGPLRRRLRNFRPDVDRYVTSLGGPLPYMVRLRRIHEETRAHEEWLAAAWEKLAGRCSDDAEFARRWRRLAARRSFHEINELIDRHNRYFPIETRLPMDPRTGDFVRIAGEPYRKRPLDTAWVLERFPLRRPDARRRGVDDRVRDDFLAGQQSSPP
jgi:hypothetical protein